MTSFPRFLSMLLASLSLSAHSNEQSLRWELQPQGGIQWNLSASSQLPHADHMAMSGRTVDLILEWQIDDNHQFHTTQVIRWPMLRTLPENTHASLQRKLSDAIVPSPLINGSPLTPGSVIETRINGRFSVLIQHQDLLTMRQTIFPSLASPAIITLYELTNQGDASLEVTIPEWNLSETTEPEKGLFGSYVISQFLTHRGIRHLAPGDSLRFALVRTARLADEAPFEGDPIAELTARDQFTQRLNGQLVLQTPDPVLNQLFQFSKIRAAESIFATRNGLMHSPGGYNKYLAAIWANDEAEYANPFFPFLGDPAGNESAMNSFRLFARYINPDFTPIPSSIISEGRGFWNGEGDRGDMAMIAYGAARFALASGNQEWSETLWPLIEWCLEYCERQKLPAGIIASDTDELENRFPAGKANLSTSSLYYDALISAAYLAKELGKPAETAIRYQEQANALRQAIEDYFGAEVEGFATYRYFEENQRLRSWICVPLTVDIFDRAEATVAALFSPLLWTKNGLLTQSGTDTVWDRSTLYALRGVFASGFPQTALEKLHELSSKRLLGNHVPYLMEADSEYNQSQLSAEAALYCRIFTEGLFGIRPIGLNAFICRPQLPSDWKQMSLQHIQAFGRSWNLTVTREAEKTRIEITDTAGKIIYSESKPNGAAHSVHFE